MNIIQDIIQLSQSMPVVATMLSAGGAVGIVGLFWQIVKKLYSIIKSSVFVSMNIYPEDNHNQGYVLSARDRVMKWLSEYQGLKFTKTIQYLGRDEEDGNQYGVGYGNHFFIWRGRPFILTIEKVDSKTSKVSNIELTLKTFGFSKKPIFNLIDSIVVNDEDIPQIVNHTNSMSIWSDNTLRNLDTVVLEKNIKNDIIKNIDNFINSKDWYLERNLNYKMGMILHGAPGTGKTSLIKAIASKYKFDLHVIQLNSISETKLTEILTEYGNSYKIVVFEDIDTVKATNKRSDENTDDKNIGTGLNLSVILNAIDGVNTCENVIFIATTNYINKLDEALIRAGRFDYHYELKPFSYNEIQEYSKMIYGDIVHELKQDCKKIKPCDLQNIVLSYKTDKQGFTNELLKKVN